MPTLNAKSTWQALEAVRGQSPVVHNITNYVVMNTTANALLALGASPVMAHAEEEMIDMVGIASALVINIGTLSREWVKSMFMAAAHAKKRGIPVVLDPVGAGATSYRTHTARELANTLRPTIIRGNASEILALRGSGKTKGVDSTEASHDALADAKVIHEACGAIVCISGETDYVVGGKTTPKILNGHPLMTRVTGLGCTASALCGAFAAVAKDPVQAVSHAMVVMGIAGEMAMEKAEGPGTLQLHFLDALYRMTEQDVARRIRVQP